MRLVTLGTARYSSDRPRRALSSPPTLATAVPDLGMLCAARHQLGIAEYRSSSPRRPYRTLTSSILLLVATELDLIELSAARCLPRALLH